MLKTRLFLTVATALAMVTGASARLAAQGVTTGAVSGTVTDPSGAPIEGAQVQIRNPRTGASAGGMTRSNGQFNIQGIEPDPGYSITVRRIGFEPATQNNVLVSLGQTTRSDFQLKQQSAVLETVSITAEATPVINPSKTGTGTTVGDSLLRRLPTLNRNFADFVQLVPQVSTSTGGLSGGGVNLRQNAIQIDGAASGDLFGLGTPHVLVLDPGRHAPPVDFGDQGNGNKKLYLSPVVAPDDSRPNPWSENYADNGDWSPNGTDKTDSGDWQQTTQAQDTPKWTMQTVTNNNP